MTVPFRPSTPSPSQSPPPRAPPHHAPPSSTAIATPLSAARGAIVLRPTTARRRLLPLLKRTHPDAGLHTPCYSCPTHTHALPLAAPHVATLGSRALQIQSPFRQTCLLASIAKHCSHHSFGFESCKAILLVSIIRFRFRATSRSQAATCASLCVDSPRHAHPFTRTLSRAPLIDLVIAT
jgi:hypothetical protein